MEDKEYQPWHPLSTVSEHIDPCECNPKRRTIGIRSVNGAVAYICVGDDGCGGYIP